MGESVACFPTENDAPLEVPVSRYSSSFGGSIYNTEHKLPWEASYDVAPNWGGWWNANECDWWTPECLSGNRTDNKNEKPFTTFMLRNIPNKYCQKELLEDLESMGFKPSSDIDFFYLPVDQDTGANLGYAFINLASIDAASRFRKLNGAQLPRYVTRKVIVVGVATVQGLDDNWAFYQRSSAMKNSDPSRRPLFWPKSSWQCESASSSDEKDDDKEDSIPEYEQVPNKDNVNQQGWVSTLMLRNIRNKYGQKDLLAEFEGLGFFPGVHIDFFYLPVDANTGSNLGYAFVNFVDPVATENFQKLNGKVSYLFKKKLLVVDKATVQGLQMNWDLYQRSSSMNSSDVSRRPLFWPQKELIHRQEAYKPQAAPDQATARIPVTSPMRRQKKRNSGKDGSDLCVPVKDSCPFDYGYNMVMPPGLGLDDQSTMSQHSEAHVHRPCMEQPRGMQGARDYYVEPRHTYEAYENVAPPNGAYVPQSCLIDGINNMDPSTEQHGAKFCGHCGTRRPPRGTQCIPALFCTGCGTRFDQFHDKGEDIQALMMHKRFSAPSGPSTADWTDYDEFSAVRRTGTWGYDSHIEQTDMVQRDWNDEMPHSV